MDNPMEFECDNEEEGFNAIKLEAVVEDYDIDDTGGSHSKITPLSAHSVLNSYEHQSSMMESRLDGQNQVVCVWANVDEPESSHLLTDNSFQTASNNGVGIAEPEQMRKAPLKSQKTARLWPISKRNGKKWQRLYSQRTVRQHKCTNCAETFLHKRSLHRHVTIVHGPKVYFWCKRCCHFYNRRDNLRTHYRSHHPMYINDVDNIQGVGRESVLYGELPLSVNPPVSSSSSSSNPGSSTIKFGTQSRKYQATQLTEREQGAVGLRQENSRMRTIFVNKEKDKMAGNSAYQSTGVSKQTEHRPTSEKQIPSSVPLDISQQARRPCAKASSSAAAASRGNPITVADVLTYQLQREINQADREIFEISDDSNSDVEPEPPHPSPVGSRDEGTVRLERGTPFKDLQVEKVMQGQVTRVSEEHQTFIYSGGEKLRSEIRKRVYNVLYLDEVGEGMQHTTQATAATSSNLISAEQLDKSIQGRVTKVTETSSKYTYSAGKKVTKEKTSRVYDVMLLGGLTNN